MFLQQYINVLNRSLREQNNETMLYPQKYKHMPLLFGFMQVVRTH